MSYSNFFFRTKRDILFNEICLESHSVLSYAQSEAKKKIRIILDDDLSLINILNYIVCIRKLNNDWVFILIKHYL